MTPSFCTTRYHIIGSDAACIYFSEFQQSSRLEEPITPPEWSQFTGEKYYPIKDSVARTAMIETAFRCAEIFSLSIVPYNLATPQTWYAKQTDSRVWIDQGSGLRQGKAKLDGCDPFSYHSSSLGFDRPFNGLESRCHSLFIEDRKQIQNIVQMFPSQSHASIETVLTSFMDDSEAKTVSLVLSRNGKPAERYDFTKVAPEAAILQGPVLP